MKTQLIKGLISLVLVGLSTLSFSSPVPPTQPIDFCEYGEKPSPGSADVVILVDSSGSMSGAWAAIIDASGSLEDAIKDKCGAEARITLLSLDKVDPGSNTNAPTGFTSHEQYITSNSSYTGPFETNDGTGLDSEQGSKGIADVSNHFPWREGACRSILYISDEWLDSITKGEAPSKASIPIGVNAANSNNVTVSTHLLAQGNGNSSVLANHYTELAESTGGTSHIGDLPSKELYIDLVSDAACKCGGGCNEEPKSCLVIDPKLECVVGKGWQVSFTNSTPGYNPTDLDITSLTTGVTVVGSSPSWTLSGVTPNSTVKLIANGVMKNGGSEKGTDLCCSTEVEIEIPDEKCDVIIHNPEEACMVASYEGPFYDKAKKQWGFTLGLSSLNGSTINEVKVTPVTSGVTLTNGPIYPVGTPSLSFTGVSANQTAEFNFCAYNKDDMTENETFDCCKMNLKIEIGDESPVGFPKKEGVK